MTLRIVAGTYCVAAQLVLQDIRIQPLCPCRGGIPKIRPALMPVQSSQLHSFFIEVKSFRAKFHPPESKAYSVFIYSYAVFLQHSLQRVQRWILATPQCRMFHQQKSLLDNSIALPMGQLFSRCIAYTDAKS